MQREEEEALKKILQLEKELDEKQRLQLEIEELKGKLEVMKHLGDDNDIAVKTKMKDMAEELNDRIDELNNLEALNQTLMVKQRQSNDELQPARAELIAVCPCNIQSFARYPYSWLLFFFQFWYMAICLSLVYFLAITLTIYINGFARNV